MKKLYILLIPIITILPIKVAAKGSLEISCSPLTAKAGETIKCNITGNSDVDIIDISSDIKLSSNLTIESFALNNTWVGDDLSNGKIEIYTNSGDPIKSNFTIGELSVKVKNNVVNSNESISLTNIEFIHTENEYPIDDVSCNIRVPSNTNTLSSLTVSGSTFTFNENTTSYELTVNSENISISATKKDEKSVVSGDIGNKSLKYGLNTFTITVTAESGTKKNYTLKITRPDNRSTEKNLLSFKLLDNKIDFNKNKTDYSLDVENNITNLAMCNNTAKDKGYLCIDNTSIKYSEKTTHKITLNNKDITNTYENNYKAITKKCDNDNNCKYYLENNEVGTLNDGKEIIYIPIGELNVGKNILQYTVTAENKSEKVYTFTINRKDEKGNIIVDKEDAPNNKEESNNKEDDKPKDNPGTGDGFIWIIVSLAVISLVVAMYIYRKKQLNSKQK